LQFSVHCETGRAVPDNAEGIAYEIDARALGAAQCAEGKERNKRLVTDDELPVLRRRDRDIGEILGRRIGDHRAVGKRQHFVDVGSWRRNHVEGARHNAHVGSEADVPKRASQDIAGGIHGARDARVRFTCRDESMGKLQRRAVFGLNRLETGLRRSLGQLGARSDEDRNGNSSFGYLARGVQDSVVTDFGEDYSPLERRSALANSFKETQRIGPFLNFFASALAMAG
jgi:hypothetical protein